MKKVLIGCLAFMLLGACNESHSEHASAAPESPSDESVTAPETEAPAAEEAEPTPLRELAPGAVQTLLAANDAVVFDANSASTRTSQGIVPGAQLLTSLNYDLSVLPEDHAKTLVFYCANEHCHASDRAADRARDNGYSDVCVMREGIAGWRAAGLETATPQS